MHEAAAAHAQAALSAAHEACGQAQQAAQVHEQHIFPISPPYLHHISTISPLYLPDQVHEQQAAQLYTQWEAARAEAAQAP